MIFSHVVIISPRDASTIVFPVSREDILTKMVYVSTQNIIEKDKGRIHVNRLLTFLTKDKPYIILQITVKMKSRFQISMHRLMHRERERIEYLLTYKLLVFNYIL